MFPSKSHNLRYQVSLLDVACPYATVGVWDSFGTERFNISQNIQKTSISSSGEPLLANHTGKCVSFRATKGCEGADAQIRVPTMDLKCNELVTPDVIGYCECENDVEEKCTKFLVELRDMRENFGN